MQFYIQQMRQVLHCINENKEDGTLLYYGNYMYPEQIDEEKEKSKKVYRRRKNLDGLV